jgi:hypothetical protein
MKTNIQLVLWLNYECDKFLEAWVCQLGYKNMRYLHHNSGSPNKNKYVIWDEQSCNQRN